MLTITKEQAFENIQKACEERLNQIYCAGVPEFAKKRLEKELRALSKSETIFQFEIYRIVAQAAKSESIPINTCNGTFIAYLIGYMLLNPLPAHYYCKSCGHSECTNDYSVFGMDLPKKKCTCGNTMISMGIGIPYELVWEDKRRSYNQSFDIRTISEFIPIAEKSISNLSFSNPVFIRPYGIDSYPTRVPILAGNDSTQNIIYDFQKRTGIKAEEIEFSDTLDFNYHSLIEIRSDYKKLVEWFDEFNPLSFRDFTRAFAFAHWQSKNGYPDIEEVKGILNSDTFKKYPFVEREDIFIYLIQNGVLTEDAVEMSNACSERRLHKLTEKYNFDNELIDILCGYRFHRFFNAAYIYELMLIVKYLEILKG